MGKIDKSIDESKAAAEVEVPAVSEGAAGASELTTRQRLELKPKERVRIPFPPGVPHDNPQAQPFEVVGINGYNYQVQCGIDVKVPGPVARILEQAGKI